MKWASSTSSLIDKPCCNQRPDSAAIEATTTIFGSQLWMLARGFAFQQALYPGIDASPRTSLSVTLGSLGFSRAMTQGVGSLHSIRCHHMNGLAAGGACYCRPRRPRLARVGNFRKRPGPNNGAVAPHNPNQTESEIKEKSC